tara:strand:- start:124 stop:801 length:678 start_codon:yes stop_codon:yes gene_type:complete
MVKTKLKNKYTGLDRFKFKTLRRRLNKQLGQFVLAHPYLKFNDILRALRITVFQAARNLRTNRSSYPDLVVDDSKVGKRRNLGAMATEAFADIGAFLRMFRTFNPDKHPATGACKKAANQTNTIYVAHLQHCSRVMLLMAMLFRITPNYFWFANGNGRNEIIDNLLPVSKNFASRKQVPYKVEFYDTSKAKTVRVDEDTSRPILKMNMLDPKHWLKGEPRPFFTN